MRRIPWRRGPSGAPRGIPAAACALAAAGLVALAGCSAEAGENAAADGEAGAQTAESGEEQEAELGFFITSRGGGNGADLGGLEGADAHCQQLAEEAGAGDRIWRAYLSTQATGGGESVDARDRIGEGPWHNAEGHEIASDVEDLHYNNASINYEYALDENGETVSSGALGDEDTDHDILTGTRMDGTAFPPGEDRTCSNWTSSGSEGSAMLGHHDRYTYDTFGSSWNEAHPSQGCSQEDLEATGGAGLFYCFAAD